MIISNVCPKQRVSIGLRIPTDHRTFQWEKNIVKATLLKFRVLADREWFSHGVVVTSQSSLYELRPSSPIFWPVTDNLSPQKVMFPNWICSSLATENARAGAGVGGSSFSPRLVSRRENYRRAQPAQHAHVHFPCCKVQRVFSSLW